jgi:hypothetical protein
MRPTPWLLAEPYRIQPAGYESHYGDSFGAFRIPYPKTGAVLHALAQDGRNARADLGDEWAWDHVSVSTQRRTPNWAEMCFIKSLFWGEDETVMQLHVPASEHINMHNFTLHLWRPLLLEIPRPPQGTV